MNFNIMRLVIDKLCVSGPGNVDECWTRVLQSCEMAIMYLILTYFDISVQVCEQW